MIRKYHNHKLQTNPRHHEEQPQDIYSNKTSSFIRLTGFQAGPTFPYFFDLLLLGLELAIDPPPPRGNFVHYDLLKLHYIRHKIKDVSPLRVAALTCNSTLYTLPLKIALNVPDNGSTMTCSYIFACLHRLMNFL